LSVAVGPALRFDALNATVKNMTVKLNSLEEFKMESLSRFDRICATVDELKDNLNATLEDLSEQQLVSSQVDAWMINTDKVLNTFNNRFAAIKPIIQQLSSSVLTSSDNFFLSSTKTGVKDDPGYDVEAMA
jgi:uncharacterized protein HemX